MKPKSSSEIGPKPKKSDPLYNFHSKNYKAAEENGTPSTLSNGTTPLKSMNLLRQNLMSPLFWLKN